MLARWRAKFGLLACGVFPLIFGQSAIAADVTLVLKGGGGFKIVGELRSYDGNKYIIINPSFGRMEVDGSRFDCVSASCPTGPVSARLSPASIFIGGPPRSVTISGSDTVGSQLMPAVIKAFSDKSRLSMTQVTQPDPRDLVYQFTNSAGREVATISLLRRGSSASFRALASKQAAIGMSSRPILEAEVTRLRSAGLGLLFLP